MAINEESVMVAYGFILLCWLNLGSVLAYKKVYSQFLYEYLFAYS